MSKLEKVTHLFLISVCCVSLVVLVKEKLLQHAASPKMTRVKGNDALIRVGQKLSLPDVSWGAASTNVVIALRSNCPYCEASLPLYRRISEIKNKAGSGLNVYAVSAEPVAAVRAFLSKANINADRYVETKTLGVPGTPTVLIVDSRGVVQEDFVGVLPESKEKELLAMLTDPKRNEP